MKKILLSTLTLAAALLVPASANAIPSVTNQYIVSDAAGNCSGGDHGLWTNNLNASGSACNNYYSFQSGSLFTEYDNGTATLIATALNPDNVLAKIAILFGDYSDTHSPVKTGGGPELPSWYFYESILKGGINVAGNDYTLSMTGGYALQIGYGANDKSPVFGGSVWITPQKVYQPGQIGSPLRHWDLNMNFESVPEPSVLILMLFGLVGITLLSPRKARKL